MKVKAIAGESSDKILAYLKTLPASSRGVTLYDIHKRTGLAWSTVRASIYKLAAEGKVQGKDGNNKNAQGGTCPYWKLKCRK